MVEEEVQYERHTLDDDSDDDFIYEEVEIEDDDEELVEESEDFETAMRRAREKEGAKSEPQGSQAQLAKRPEVIDDFIRNYFLKMGLHKSLDTFQTEWYEKVQSGDIRGEDLQIVPDLYLRNQSLDNQVKTLRTELEKARDVAFKARSTWDKFRKERDFHRMNHRRVVQEKNKLVGDLRRLREHVKTYEPVIRGLENKYESAMKEKAMARLQSDRLNARVETLEVQLKQAASRVGTAATGLSTTNKSRQMSPSSSPKREKEVTRRRDSSLPAEDRENPFLRMTLESSNVQSFSQRKEFKGHIAAVSAIKCHPKRALVATASDDCTWKLWSLPTGDLAMCGDGHKDWVSDLDFHPRGTHLATSSGDNTVKLWDFRNSKCCATFTDHSQSVWSVAFHDMGDFVATGSMDHTIKLLDVNSLRCRLTLRGHVDSVNAIGWQPFSSNVCSCSGDKTVSLWDARTGQCVQTFYGHTNSCNSVCFNLRGDTIASSDADGVARFWDIRTVQQICEAPLGPHPLNKVTFDRSGKTLVCASSDNSIKVVSPDDGTLLGSLSGHTDAVQAIDFSADSKTLVSGSNDCTFRMWG